MFHSVKAKEGASLVMVICIGAFLMAFALSMIYTAGLLLSRSNRRLEQERSYQLARSFSQILDLELKKYNALGDAPEKSFYRYAVHFLEGQYGEYDPDYLDETIFHYTAGEAPEGMDESHYGTIRVALYKEAGEEEQELSGTVSSDASIEDILTNPIQRYVFTVEVTAETGSTSFRYRTEYRQTAIYEVRFTYGDSKRPVVLAGSEWHYDNASGELCNFDSPVQLEYEYLTGLANMKSCSFESAYLEEGEGI